MALKLLQIQLPVNSHLGSPVPKDWGITRYENVCLAWEDPGFNLHHYKVPCLGHTPHQLKQKPQGGLQVLRDFSVPPSLKARHLRHWFTNKFKSGSPEGFLSPEGSDSVVLGGICIFTIANNADRHSLRQWSENFLFCFCFRRGLTM